MIALLASLSMVFTDILGVMMAQYEAESRNLPERKTWRDYIFGGWPAWRAAVMDHLQWTVGIATTTVAVTAFSGNNWTLKFLVYGGVMLANLIGSRAGQEIGLWTLRRSPKKIQPLERKVAELEKLVQSLLSTHASHCPGTVEHPQDERGA